MIVKKSRRGAILLLLIIITTTVGQNCISQPTCRRCISQPGCAWCFQADYSGVRCLPANNFTLCNATEIANPYSSILNQTFITGPINLAEVILELRVGDPQTFRVQVTPQRDLPLDLYILIDLSASMAEELSTVQSIAGEISNRIEGVTTNVRLGLGSFNEKLVQPYAAEPFEVGGPLPSGVPPNRYAFRHTVNLTANSEVFAAEVQNAALTGNADFPENGMEALAQVITCQDIIGWRERVNGVGTRAVLFMTDAEFHYAGEGRLGGILNPYNGECLLEPSLDGGAVEFERYAELDYPSVGQIVELLREFETTVIFAIQEDHLASYEFLASSILNADSLRSVVAGFQVTANNDDGQEEILGIIEDKYTRILQSVSLDKSNITSNLLVNLVTTCPSGSVQIGATCESVQLDTAVNFDITVTLNSCEGLEHGQPVRHTITSPSFGSFDLVFRPICECQCAEDAVRNSQDCNGAGALSCGVCECFPGRCGARCEMVIDNGTLFDCPRGGANNEKCSGRGICDCTCICDEPDDPNQMIFGEACECDNFRCDVDDQGRVCSGRGMCCNGNCECDLSPNGNLYRGDPTGLELCQCEPIEEACIDPESNLLCNNNGTCGCQFCSCQSDSIGKFCELRNVDSCGFVEDEMCISQCREEFSTLPPVCDICNRQRPLLFVAMQDIISSTGRVMTPALEAIANERLNAGDNSFTLVRSSCQFTRDDICENEYYILANQTHLIVVALIEEECRSNNALLLIPAWSVGVIILTLMAILVVGVVVVGIKIFMNKQKNPIGPMSSSTSDESLPLVEVKDTVIPGNCIELYEAIGQGCLGVVHKSYLHEWHNRSRYIAVKILKNLSESDIDYLVEDSRKLSELDHVHVLSFIGVCIDSEASPSIVMPYMANGSLLSYLQEKRLNLTIAEDATEDMIAGVKRKLLAMCLQIVLGMSYLAQNGIAHGFLSARNCMISDDFVIMVADFGLSFLLKPGQEKFEEILEVSPIYKWMAPESIQHGIFTEKSDVWSFGVTCWEVFSLGQDPYPDMDHATLMKFLKHGGRLDKPENPACSELEYFCFMEKCWIDKPKQRPFFEEITRILGPQVEDIAD